MKKMLKQQVMAALAVTALLGAVCPAVQAAALISGDGYEIGLFGKAGNSTTVERTGKETVAGVFGGALAMQQGDASVSNATGKSQITIGLENQLNDQNKGAFVTAVMGALTGKLDEENFGNKGAALGVFGGGAALATGLPTSEVSTATAGSEINLNSGYVVGAMGGGVAAGWNDSTVSSAMTDTVNINVNGAEVIGLFGNGLAYHTRSSDNQIPGPNIEGTTTVSAVNTNINVQSGSVDGIIGGGVAIDDTNADHTNAIAETTGTATINVTGGTVNKVNWTPVSQLLNVAGVINAAGDAAIAAGGVAYGGGAVADVANAVVNINDGTVNGDIYGGGIAVYGWNPDSAADDGMVDGSHVGTSTINLNGGKVDGNVYAGGAASSTDLTGTGGGYTYATATVDNAVINLAGTDVTGILYGTGKVEGTTASSTVKNSTLNLIGVNELGLTESGKSKIQNFTNVVATAGSETVIGEGFTTDSAALIDGKGVTKVTVEDGARLNLTKLEPAAADQSYKIATNTTEGSTFWSNDALIYDRTSGYYAEGTVSESDEGFTVKYSKIDTSSSEKVEEAANSMAAALGARSLLGMFREGMSNNWTDFNEAAKEYMKDWSTAENAAAGQKGMLIGEDAAVTGNTVSIARDMADNVMQRLSFTDDYVQDAGWVNENGGIWAKYIHRTYDTDGMGSSMGGIHSSTDYDGVIVGMDFGKSGKFQSGVAFHYGSGDGHGLVSRNDYDAWGITMYGSMKDEAAGTNLMADIGWMTSDNDIDGTVDGKSMSADRDVDAWTIGLRGEKEYAFGRNQLVPYVGLRYMSVNPGRYTAYYNGQAAFDYDADNQNLWMLPIGVSFRNETVTAGGWRITPKVDLSYIWAFGDTDTDMTVNAGSTSSTLYYDVMDDSSWLASLGVEASKDVWSFGVGYGYQKGDDEKNRTWFVNASYAF